MNSEQNPTNLNSEPLDYNPLNPPYPSETGIQQAANIQTHQASWNPFSHTARDIKRTEELAQKNLVVTVLLGLLLPIGNLFYLGRGANSAKLFVYTTSLGLIMAVAGGSAVNPEVVGRGTFQLSNFLMGLEQIVCISQAKNRNQL
ncbi:MAG TPA: hypothetical protein V6C78_07635 [Crinalium sp.]|jgi:hypothetical protein